MAFTTLVAGFLQSPSQTVGLNLKLFYSSPTLADAHWTKNVC